MLEKKRKRIKACLHYGWFSYRYTIEFGILSNYFSNLLLLKGYCIIIDEPTRQYSLPDTSNTDYNISTYNRSSEIICTDFSDHHTILFDYLLSERGTN